MNKQEIYDHLTRQNVWHRITEHEAIYNMAEIAKIDVLYPEAAAKNLFVRDNKKRMYYLITVKGDKRVDLKEFKQTHNTRPLSFASADDLMSIMGLIPGAVTPFGLLNDEERRVHLFLDRAFLDSPGLIGVHPNDNTATVWLNTESLIRMIEEHGNPVDVVSF